VTPERWQQVKELFRSALEHKVEERAAFLDRACDGDDALRREVESLLSSFAESDSIIQRPVAEAAAELFGGDQQAEKLVGQRVGHYDVVALLGEGGMGTVYLARDTKLGRKVAVKLLPSYFISDADRLRRFKQEACAASSLNHPNILTIHEIGQSEDRHFIATEFVDGETLRASLARAQMKIGEALDIGAQVASALAAAHEAGIVHRDIKPENIMLRRDALVKVLDFGLAKLTRQQATSAEASTWAMFKTGSGVVMGTARYMSPEQARGEKVTSASDIFSLGLVFYEMAAGQHPFQADSQIGVLHAIITQTPLAPSRLNPEIPATVETLILRMLEQDWRLRPTAAEVRTALSGVAEKRAGLETSRLTTSPKRLTVGREKQRIDLRAGWSSVVAGRGLLLCVSGEAGIGKTTLVEDFLSELTAGREPCAIALGRSSERLAGTEAYLPFLEAVESLLHVEGKEFMARTMKVLAPTWYAQVVPLATGDSSDAHAPTEAPAGSQEQMKRELGAYFQEISRTQPLVLFFDDLHWADVSTIDLMAYLASKFAALRLLLVVTYRPSDLILAKHPFLQLKPDLQARGVCHEIPLDFLSSKEIKQYLGLEFPEHRFPEELSALIYEKTEGSPLFMVDLVRYLRDRQVISQERGHWVARSVPEIERELPESVRGMIERKVAQLAEDDRRLLVAASVQGYEFDSAILATVMELDLAEVEERLEALERVYAFVRQVEEREFPNRILTLRYRFTHVLYQNALYGSLRPTRKAQLSAAVAQTLLSYYSEQSANVATELAVLFEAAREFESAAHYFLLAAQNAAGLSAYREVVILTRRGLEALKSLPETPERAKQELLLQTTLGPALMSILVWGASEVEAAYTRARELCQQVGETPQLFPVIWGLSLYWQVRAEFQTSRELGEQLLALAQKVEDPALLLLAHRALGEPCAFTGEFEAALTHFEQALAIYVPEQHRSLAILYGGSDQGVECLGCAGRSLWPLGYPDQALQRCDEAISLAREISHPGSVAMALIANGMIHRWCRNVQRVRELAEETIAIATEREIAPWIAGGMIFRGWAMAERGQAEEGIAQIRQGSTIWRAGGMVAVPYQLELLAEAYAKAGQAEEGLRALDEALAITERTHEGLAEAEIHRLRGELLLMREMPDEREAESCFREAIEIARRQNAKSFELRAVMSLSRLLRKQNKQAEARQMLAEVYDWFTEGFETLDLKEARILLAELIET